MHPAGDEKAEWHGGELQSLHGGDPADTTPCNGAREQRPWGVSSQGAAFDDTARTEPASLGDFWSDLCLWQHAAVGGLGALR